MASNSRRTVEFANLVGRVHTLFIACATSKRECAGLYIFTIRSFAAFDLFIKDGNPFRNGNWFLALRAKDTWVLALRCLSNHKTLGRSEERLEKTKDIANAGCSSVVGSGDGGSVSDNATQYKRAPLLG
jgi:hypothetical protein